MPVDVSMYSNLPKPINPLEMIGQYAGAANALAENRLINQDVAARTGIGQVFQQAIGPDGAVDPTKLNLLIKNNSGIGFMAPQAIEHGQTITSQGIGIQGQRLGLANTGAATIQNAFGSLLNTNPAITADQAAGTLTQLLREGRILPEQYAPALKGIYLNARDPQALRNYLAKGYLQSLGPAAQGAPETIGVNPDGTVRTGTTGQAITKATGSQPPPMPIARGAGGGAPPAAAPQQGIITDLGPTGKASLAQLAQDRVAVSHYKEAVFPLEHALPAIRALGATGTGPGKEQLNDIVATLRGLGVPLPQGVVDKNTAFAEARKYLTQNVLANSDTGTNEKLLAAFSGNPNVSLPQAAVYDLARAGLAVRRMNAAKTLEFDRENQPGSSYSKWGTTFSTNQDPRAYGFDLMTLPERDRTWAAIQKEGPAAVAKFKASLAVAHNNGLMGAPNAQQ